MYQPKLSVITVVYNNVRDIKRTMLSVLSQTYLNIEYIIIDGGSTDGTLQIIENYKQQLSHLVTEKDKGIYFAMNRGLAIASGDYVLFMNSGDEIHSLDTVEKIFSNKAEADIYYGETEMFDQQWKSLGKRRHSAPQRFNWRSFQYGMNVSHQSIYIRRSITVPFDTGFRLSADIDWIIEAARKARRIVNTKMYVAKYMVGGISKAKHRQSLIERFRIFNKHYGLIPNLINHVVIALKLGIYYIRHRRTND
ncbi:MAG: glycosyltransferase [Flavobacterium sp.]|nr:glycosyltransferase [Pedobacter sp.]